MTGTKWYSKDTVAVVTGANRGIGYELVKMLAKDGLTVVLTARDSSKGQAALEALKAEGFGSVMFHPLATASAESADKLAQWLKSEFGGIDILINNAGIYCADEVAYESSKDAVDTNYYGTRNVIEKLLPLLKPSPAGARIVNVTSRAGAYEKIPGESLKQQFRQPADYSTEFVDSLASKYLEDVKAGRADEGGWITATSDIPAYSESKIFLNAYTVALAKSLENKGILVTSMCPGVTQTDMFAVATAGGFVKPEKLPLKTIEEGADTAVWLALLPKADLLPKTGKFFAERQEYQFASSEYA